MQNSENTQNKILEAAKNEFFEKGFKGARMQAIADRASINKGLLHYYFKSKEKLFSKVFEESILIMWKELSLEFKEEQTFTDMLEQVIDKYLDTMKQNALLPKFIISEINEDPEIFIKRKELIVSTNMMQKLIKKHQESIEKGIIKPIPFLHIGMSIISLVSFPFLIKPLYKETIDKDEAEFAKFIEQRRTIIKSMIRNLIAI
ncbi:TetR/AcrR family transcriptional regulator [Aureibacter tunicatorum]|uniref:AcrR family transcriptional regulator n=1 Tax=Aureibacter tunicatorum TaxID=866807 RepID=A0AAE3XJE7_9BACT|nr:TetR/AcrR family transcriptional regulator [Aureibacter tunicatorum]MDR6237515.1 AcrR family transcriptional regulator [Aureibacter tunicatorum]BDD02549.1 TetR family transcriptional regulator [Aureibacter tunicatorum]